MADTSPNEHMLALNVAPGKNVRPSRVVKLSALGDFCIEEAGPADIPFGIAQNWTSGAPGTPFDDGFVSRATNRAVMVWAGGCIARAALKDNTAAMNPGVSVGADVDGELVQVSTGWAVGFLMESGSAAKSQRLRIFVWPHHRGTGSD